VAAFLDNELEKHVSFGRVATFEFSQLFQRLERQNKSDPRRYATQQSTTPWFPAIKMTGYTHTSLCDENGKD
jgi:hypothetical protein